MEFEPHSYNHPDMTNRGYPVRRLSDPGSHQRPSRPAPASSAAFSPIRSGRYDQFVVDVLRSAYFWGAVVTEQGATHTADDLFTLRRVRVHGGDNLDSFILTLNLDW